MPPQRHILIKTFLFIMLFTASVLFVKDTVTGGKTSPLQVFLLILCCIFFAYGIAKIVFRLFYSFIFTPIENFNASLPDFSDEEKERVRKLRLKIIAFITLLLTACPLLTDKFSTNNTVSVFAFMIALPFVFLFVFLAYYIFVSFPANYIRRMIKKCRQEKEKIYTQTD